MAAFIFTDRDIFQKIFREINFRYLTENNILFKGKIYKQTAGVMGESIEPALANIIVTKQSVRG